MIFNNFSARQLTSSLCSSSSFSGTIVSFNYLPMQVEKDSFCTYGCDNLTTRQFLVHRSTCQFCPNWALALLLLKTCPTFLVLFGLTVVLSAYKIDFCPFCHDAWLQIWSQVYQLSSVVEQSTKSHLFTVLGLVMLGYVNRWQSLSIWTCIIR